jgi:hypothetical protein
MIQSVDGKAIQQWAKIKDNLNEFKVSASSHRHDKTTSLGCQRSLSSMANR